ncbi:hypothetical protein KM043_000636 [Ampulex compressa]|nr:hypothetical protein KM043_000636 [Ampulex compressa]
MPVDAAIQSPPATFKPKENNIDARGEHMRKEIAKIHKFDIAIQNLSRQMKVEIEKTRRFQYENRKKLEDILLQKKSESKKLAENTTQFFQLCPEYTYRGANVIDKTNNNK